MEKNNVDVVGILQRNFVFEQKFNHYRGVVDIPRKSGFIDSIPVVVPGTLNEYDI